MTIVPFIVVGTISLSAIMYTKYVDDRIDRRLDHIRSEIRGLDNYMKHIVKEANKNK